MVLYSKHKEAGVVGDVDKGIVARIRKLYRESPAAQRLFDWVASMQRDATATTIDRLAAYLGISRYEAVALARELEGTGCGTFVVGRRGQKSRFAWGYSRISLGQAAAGEDDKLEHAVNPVSEAEDDAEEAGSSPAAGGELVSPLPNITIAQAKAALALSLGIPITAIEIVIRT